MPSLLDKNTLATILLAQQNEITEYFIYLDLVRKTRDPHNKNILETVAKDEMRHYQFWRSISN